MDPTMPEFLAAVERQPFLASRPAGRGELLAFLEACWPLVLEDPDPRRWADQFAAALRETSRVGVNQRDRRGGLSLVGTRLQGVSTP